MYKERSNINELFGLTVRRMAGTCLHALCYLVGMSRGGGTGFHTPRPFSLVALTMSEKEKHLSIAQQIVITFLTYEDVKLAEIHRRLLVQFWEET